MGLFSVMRTGMKLAGGPLGKVAGMLPGVSTVINAASLAGSAYDMYKDLHPSSGGGGLPALPGGGGLPALPGMSVSARTTSGSTGVIVGGGGGGSNLRTIHSTPLFPTDMASLKGLEAAGILVPFAKLGTKRYAPKGYRVVHVNGMTIGLRTEVARKLHLVGPTHKPPISVGQYHALKKAHHTVKKLHKLGAMARFVQKNVGHGGKLIHHHPKKAK